jgi:hypothetical protein
MATLLEGEPTGSTGRAGRAVRYAGYKRHPNTLWVEALYQSRRAWLPMKGGVVDPVICSMLVEEHSPGSG